MIFKSKHRFTFILENNRTRARVSNGGWRVQFSSIWHRRVRSRAPRLPRKKYGAVPNCTPHRCTRCRTLFHSKRLGGEPHIRGRSGMDRAENTKTPYVATTTIGRAGRDHGVYYSSSSALGSSCSSRRVALTIVSLHSTVRHGWWYRAGMKACPMPNYPPPVGEFGLWEGGDHRA